MKWLGRRRPPLPPREEAPWTVELQIHPARGRSVRRFVLSRRRLTLWSIGLLLYVFFLSTAALVAPGVVRGWVEGEVYGGLSGERSREGERLRGRVQDLEELGRRAEGLDLTVQKILLAHGLRSSPTPRGVQPEPAPSLAGSIYAATVERGDQLRRRAEGHLHRIDQLLAVIERHDQEVGGENQIPSICPLPGNEIVALAFFGRRRNPFTRQLDFHAGLDLAAPRGTPVRAPAAGVVVFAGAFSSGQSAAWWRRGNLVVLRHGERFLSLLGHCDEIKVRAGEQVARGQEVATVGSTGMSAGPHLYYELRRRGEDGELRPVDPVRFIFDRSWPNESRLARGAQEPATFDPLPRGLER